MKNNISQFTECANCGACYNICPVDAIKAVKDNLFYELSINEEKCIDCGKCVKICPVNNVRKRQNLLCAVGGYHKNSDILAHSSSGGAFTAIAQAVLAEGGVVYGAVYSEDYKKVLFSSTDCCDIDRIRRSKYVESDLGLVFREIKQQLISGRQVMFCAAPCQVAGLKRFLEKEYENLLACDFACGGLPSHSIYNKYIENLEKKFQSKVINVNFRSKDYGWSTHSQNIKFENGKIYKKLAIIDEYFYAFIYGRVSIRENCITCKFANNHYSDIILADFWKYKISEMYNKNGLSLILANSEKGLQTIEKLKLAMNLNQLDLNEAKYNCVDKTEPDSEYLMKRKNFYDEYNKNGLRIATIKAGMPNGIKEHIVSLKIKIKNKLK